ncbi:DUF2971 domain-containing protein [Meridianimarinicoccus sp. MJW13]|uniref:DUF2971 domain-containing protein n=1 Tax=Meridianimarinicoccus sp. MJW13 TaxID=2720031 RepID=UPI001865C9EF|nr:DUF2971 domain-containing protein [Fluviibacterium sp. MJW13]
MWSHYADGLRGLCLVFDDDELLEASPRSTFAVNVAYQKNPPTADAFIYAIANDQMDFHLMSIEEAEDRSKHIGERDPFVEDYRKVAGDAYLSKTEILQRVFATKPLEWEYEAERRLLVRASGNDTEPIFHRFPKTALREILIGERMPDSFRARLEALVAEHYSHVSTRAVARSSSTYRLKIR